MSKKPYLDCSFQSDADSSLLWSGLVWSGLVWSGVWQGGQGHVVFSAARHQNKGGNSPHTALDTLDKVDRYATFSTLISAK